MPAVVALQTSSCMISCRCVTADVKSANALRVLPDMQLTRNGCLGPRPVQLYLIRVALSVLDGLQENDSNSHTAGNTVD
jgi:hypothetical protein